MNEIKIFENQEFGKLRTLEKDNEMWFVGKDVAAALGYKDTVNALKSHVESEDKAGWRIATQYGTKETTVINESGLYSLIFGSKLESAKRFKHWVTSEVLPSIRKTGGYTMGYDRMELAKLFASCKLSSSVRAICALYGIEQNPFVVNKSVTPDEVMQDFLETYQLEGRDTHSVYDDYQQYCDERGMKPKSLCYLSKSAHSRLNIVTVRKKRNGEFKQFYCYCEE